MQALITYLSNLHNYHLKCKQLSNKRLTSTTTSASTWHLLATANEQTTVNRFSKWFSQAPRPITVTIARSYQSVVGNVRFSCHLPWHSDKDFVFPTFQAEWQIVLRDVVSAALGLRLGLCAGPIEGQLFPREAFLEFGLAGAQTAAEADKAQGQQFGRKHCFDFRFFSRLFWSSSRLSHWSSVRFELSALTAWIELRSKLNMLAELKSKALQNFQVELYSGRLRGKLWVGRRN